MLYGFERYCLPKGLKTDSLQKDFNLVRTASRSYLVYGTRSQHTAQILSGWLSQSSLERGFDVHQNCGLSRTQFKKSIAVRNMSLQTIVTKRVHNAPAT